MAIWETRLRAIDSIFMIQQLIYGLKAIQCLLQRGSPNANIVNGKLYVVGGDMNDRSPNVVESYDPIANRWTTHTPMSTSRHLCCFCGGMLHFQYT